jgi:hypothetical protein
MDNIWAFDGTPSSANPIDILLALLTKIHNKHSEMIKAFEESESF